MRLIEDCVVVGWDESTAHREIEKEQRVVDDDDIRVARFFARTHVVAAIGSEEVARLHDAVVGVGIEIGPQTCRGHEFELGAIARPGAIGPLEQRDLFRRPREHELPAHRLELIAVDVVRSPFELHDERAALERSKQERDVLVDELVLER